MNNEKRFAVLIDADNISPKYINFIMDEVSNNGLITIKRIYGDWTSERLSSWKETVLTNSLSPIQQFENTIGKNSTDSAMIIDAMDILYSKNIDGFYLCTSDSDFTRLASRLRESGMIVNGMGEKKTPPALVKACNKFTYLEIMNVENKDNKSKKIEPDNIKPKQYIIDLLKNSDDGKLLVSLIGIRLIKKYPDFDSRTYDCTSLTSLLEKWEFKIGIPKENKNGANPGSYKFAYLQ
jgi:uncharacterized protein (TIGR00288 family)